LSYIHRPFKSLVSSDPGNTKFSYQRAAPSPPQKETAGKNNSVPRFIIGNVQKKTDYKWLNAITKFIVKVRVENLQKFCCSSEKFVQFPTAITVATIYVRTVLVYIDF
jgi:hypothetical protein